MTCEPFELTLKHGFPISRLKPQVRERVDIPQDTKVLLTLVGADAKPYQEKQVKQAVEAVNNESG